MQKNDQMRWDYPDEKNEHSNENNDYPNESIHYAYFLIFALIILHNKMGMQFQVIMSKLYK